VTRALRHEAPKKPASVDRVLASAGTPLDRASRAAMESRFGADFSRVRVHTNEEAAASARDIRAAAYTSGSHVVFGANRYEPHTREGQGLIAHELAHVIEGGSDVRRQALPEPPEDDSRMVIAAVPDMLMTDVQSPQKIDVTIKDASVASTEWELIEPDGTVRSTMRTKPGAPYILEKEDFGDTGRFTLRCTGYDKKDKPVVRANRHFNVLRSDLATGVRRFGTSGSLVFTKYAPKQLPGIPPSADVELSFYPAPSVKCDQIMFVQAVQVLNESGDKMNQFVHSELGERKSGTGWSIDKLPGSGESPYYSVLPDVKGRLVPQPKQGQIGSGGLLGSKASLIDNPSPGFNSTARFESCAVCRDQQPHPVYGCATWGFVIDGQTIKMMPRDFKDEASEDFIAAAASWRTWVAKKKAGTTP